MGDISRNFSYSEFKVSASFPRLAEQIVLTKADKVKMHWQTHIFLQPLRDILNDGVVDVQLEIQINISSGIRDVALNSAVGGVSVSDHLYRNLSCATDFTIGGNTHDYLEIAQAFCYSQRRYVKQFIYYLPYTDDRGRQQGNFIHVSLFDGGKQGEVLFCGSREGRMYFPTYEEAEVYMRRE